MRTRSFAAPAVLQGVPVRLNRNRELQDVFRAPPGTCLLATDYSALELRVMETILRETKTAPPDGT